MADANVPPRSESPSVEEQESFWNSWNAQVRENHVLDPVSVRRAETIIQLLRSLNLTYPKIIEIGCGTGWFCEQLAAFGTVTGIDLASDVIARARQRLPSITFMAGDIITMDMPRERYDVVVTVSTLSHVYDQRAFIDRLSDLLKPGGYLILATQNRFVLGRSADVIPTEPGHIRKWLDMRGVRRLLASDFRVMCAKTILPQGHLGILRLVNSYRLESILAKAIGQSNITSLKERLGLGQTIIVLATKR